DRDWCEFHAAAGEPDRRRLIPASAGGPPQLDSHEQFGHFVLTASSNATREWFMMHFIRHRSRVHAAVLFLILTVCGCGGGYSPEANRVDPEQARDMLESVLISWQLGDSPQFWRQQDPQVVIQDVDWSAGKKLEEFEF